MTLTHPGANPSCPHCRGAGHRVVRAGNWLDVTACSCVTSPCPACADQGYVAVGEGFRAPVRRCAHAELEVRARRFAAARIPGRYADATLRDGTTATGPSATAWAAVDAWVLRARKSPPADGLVLYGPYGTGKTHVMAAAARSLTLDWGRSVRFVDFSHLLTDLKSAIERREGTPDLMEPLATVDVLILDEIGKGRKTEFEDTVIDEIVSRRYNAGLPILGTTNFTVGAATGRAAANAAAPDDTMPALIDRVGERVFDRLQETCDFLPMNDNESRRAAAADARERARSTARTLGDLRSS